VCGEKVSYSSETRNFKKVKPLFYAPGFSSYQCFPQNEIPFSTLIRSATRNLWDITYYSGDLEGATEV
jgi:hypothetical protein